VAPLQKTDDTWSRTSALRVRTDTLLLAGVLAAHDTVAASDADVCVGKPGTACDDPLTMVGLTGEAVDDDATVEQAAPAKRWTLFGFVDHRPGDDGRFAVWQRLTHPFDPHVATGMVLTLPLT
jgi:hypothetical protein